MRVAARYWMEVFNIARRGNCEYSGKLRSVLVPILYMSLFELE